MPRLDSLRVLAVVPFVACASPWLEGASVALAPSLLPNVGLAGSLAVPFRPAGAAHLELRFTDQFLDDKRLADDGNPEAGNWAQLDVGWLWFRRDAHRTWTARFGLTGFEARGEPNLADEPGDYVGLYAGAGRLTELAPGWWLGPELTLIFATGPDPQVWIPQLTWGLRWVPRARGNGRSY